MLGALHIQRSRGSARQAVLAALVVLACTRLESASDRFDPASAGTAGELVTSGSDGGATGGMAGTAGSASTAGGESGGRSGAGGSRPTAGEGGAPGQGGSAGEVVNDAGAGGAPDSEGCPPLAERTTVELGPEAVIDRNTLWKCDTVHRVAGTLLVAPGATLTIEPGSVVTVAKGGLVLAQRRARVVAEGRADAPIVFTSAEPEGVRAPGDWRGLVLVGDGPSHAANVPVYDTLGDARADYGGGPEGDPDASCGTLRYVRVEFAGGSLNEAATPGSALTLAGCGKGTLFDFVQVHRGTDGLGLFGGTVDLRHVLVTHNARGDGIEWTGGYRGDLQFVIAQSLGAATALLGSNSEADPLAEPVSAPRIFNALLAGSAPLVPGAHFGLVLQFGSQALLKNSVILGFVDAAFDLRLPADTLENGVGAGKGVDVSNVLLFRNARDYSENALGLAAMASMRSGDPGLSLAVDRTAPAFLPMGSEVLIEPGAISRPFDTTATFRGAVAPGGPDWTRGWTAFPAN